MPSITAILIYVAVTTVIATLYWTFKYRHHLFRKPDTSQLQQLLDERAAYNVENDYLSQQNSTTAQSPVMMLEKNQSILEQMKTAFDFSGEAKKNKAEQAARDKIEARADQIKDNVPVLSVKGYCVSDESRNDGWCLNAGYYFVLTLMNTQPEPINHILVTFPTDFPLDQLTETEQHDMYMPGSTSFKYTLYDAETRKRLTKNTDFKIKELAGMSEKVLCAFPVTTRFNGHLNTDENGDGSIVLSCNLKWQRHSAFYYMAYRYNQPGALKVSMARVSFDGEDVPIISRYLKNNTEIKYID